MLSWDHNAYYHHAILRRLPAHSARVLEVGSGRGHLAVRLAERADEVDALDLDPAMVEATRAIVPANVRCRRADVTTAELPAGCYDAVVSLSVLHHLDLATALPLLARALRPGGVLVAVALPKSDLPRELPVEAAASLVHHALGTVFTAVRHPYRVGLPHPTHPGPVPMKDPTLTTRQVRDLARTALPGADVRRLLLWRYLLTWTKPSAATATSPTSA